MGVSSLQLREVRGRKNLKNTTKNKKELKKQGIFFVSTAVDEHEINRFPAEKRGRDDCQKTDFSGR